jgi:hypothetical protein
MKRKELERRGTAALAAVALLGVGSAIGIGCSGGSSGPAPSNSPASTARATVSQPMLTTAATTTVAPAALTRDDWRRSLTKTPVPKDGCFRAKRPSTTWEEVPCVTDNRFLPVEFPRPPGSTTAPRQAGGSAGPVGAREQVGAISIDDYAPILHSGSFSWAEGSFFGASNLKDETDSKQGPNWFSLQLNSDANLPAKLCSQAASPSECSGWAQFVYSSNTLGGQYAGLASIFIQYWMINFGKTCPNPCAEPGDLGCWNTETITNPQTGASQIDCMQNGANTQSLAPSVITDLPDFSLTGIAGSSDTLVFSTGDEVLAVSQPETALGITLSGSWQLAEFNVFGNGNGSEANINTAAGDPPANINVQILVDNAGNVTTAELGPSIAEESTTGESSNMNLQGYNTACSLGGEIPGIQFFETTNTNTVTPPACPSTVRSSAPQLVWYQQSSGLLIYWESDTSGNTWGVNYLLGNCGPSGSCSSTWAPAGMLANQIWWYDSAGPYVLPWVWLPGDAGVGELSLGSLYQPCAESIGCFTSPTWTPVGPAIEGVPSSGFNGYILYDASLGQFSLWTLGSELASTLDMTCKASSCGWKPVLTADVNNDGNTDIIFESTSGQPAIMVWNLNYQNKTFEVTGTMNFSEALPAPNLIGAADVNGDGYTDITFWNPTSGAVISWLLNGSGGLLSNTQTLTGNYVYSTSNPWSPLGYASLP